MDMKSKSKNNKTKPKTSVHKLRKQLKPDFDAAEAQRIENQRHRDIQRKIYGDGLKDVAQPYVVSHDYENWIGAKGLGPMPPNPTIPIQIETIISELRSLFSRKNEEYQSPEKWNANFLDAPPVTQFGLHPMTYCMILAAKQDDAFWKVMNRVTLKDLVYAQGKEVSNIRERLMDGAVYRIIALALLNEQEKP